MSGGQVHQPVKRHATWQLTYGSSLAQLSLHSSGVKLPVDSYSGPGPRLVELWEADASRGPFWDVALRLLQADGVPELVPEIGRLLGRRRSPSCAVRR